VKKERKEGRYKKERKKGRKRVLKGRVERQQEREK